MDTGRRIPAAKKTSWRINSGGVAEADILDESSGVSAAGVGFAFSIQRKNGTEKIAVARAAHASPTNIPTRMWRRLASASDIASNKKVVTTTCPRYVEIPTSTTLRYGVPP